MADIINLKAHRNKDKPHSIAELICLSCFYRWLGVFPKEMWLKDIECPNCKKTGAAISTGQDICTE